MCPSAESCIGLEVTCYKILILEIVLNIDPETGKSQELTLSWTQINSVLGHINGTLENIAKAAISTNSPTTDFKCDSVVLNIFSDKIYNRSVISIGGKFNSSIKAKLPPKNQLFYIKIINLGK